MSLGWPKSGHAFRNTQLSYGAAGVAPEETFGLGVDDGYAGAADSWAAGQPAPLEADDEEGAALSLYNLALDFQERSQASEARLLDQFEESSTRLMDKLDEHITKVSALGFLRPVKNAEQSYEVRRILKAFIDGQWLADLDTRLGEYASSLTPGEDGE